MSAAIISTYGMKSLVPPPTSGSRYPADRLSTTPTISPPTAAPAIELEAAQDHHWEHFQADQCELVIHPEKRAPDDAAQGGNDARHGPGQGGVAPHVDAHGGGDLLIVRHRAHGQPRARVQEEPCEADEEDDADHSADEIDRRQHHRADEERIIGDRQRDRARARTEGKCGNAAQQRGNPDRRHDNSDDRPAEQRTQHETLQSEAERHHSGDGKQRGNPPGQHGDRGGGYEAAEHDELALCEVECLGRFENQDEAESDQRIHHPDEQAVRHQHQGERRVKHAPEPRSAPLSGRRCRRAAVVPRSRGSVAPGPVPRADRQDAPSVPAPNRADRV